MSDICVIGGSGFIGTRLVSRFKTDLHSKIVNIDKNLSAAFPELTKIGDVRSVSDLESFIKNDAVIINLAAEHRDDVSPKSLYYDVNVEGAENICRVAESKNIKKIIFTSSVAVYGFAPLGADENCTMSPFNDYG